MRQLLDQLRPVLFLALAVTTGPAARAHDLWLLPPADAAPRTAVTVKAVSGTEFPKGDHAPEPAKFERRLVVAPDQIEGKLEPAGTEDVAGLLTFRPDKAGVYAVAVETRPKVISLEADAFNAYLVSDGLPHVYQLRAKEKTLDRPATERYSKSPKALVRVGDGKVGDPCRALGLPLEIVPVQDPFARKVGDTMRVKALFRNKPLADAHLGWDHPGDGEAPAGTVRTDAKGEALVPVRWLGLTLSAGCGERQSPPVAATPGPSAVETAGLRNVFRVSERVYSESSPGGCDAHPRPL